MSQQNDVIARMIRPEALQKDEPLVWSPGTGNQVWQLFCAAITGDNDTILQLLQQDPQLVNAGHDYVTPMFFAVRENQLATARLLLEHGASPVTSGTSDTLLEIAQYRGFTDMQQLLLKALTGNGGDTTAGDTLGAAIREYDIPRVRALLQEHPEWLHARDGNTNQPIHWAVMTRQPEMIDMLLELGADINSKRADGAAPLQLVNGDYGYRGWRDVPDTVTVRPREILMHLIKRGVYVDMCTACYIGDLNRVQELLNEDHSLANKLSDYVTYYALSGSPIRNAAAAGNLDVVQLLLDNGADPNLPEPGIAPRGHALHSAVCNNHIEVVKLLLQHGAYPNVDVESSADTLSAAIAADNKPMIELLCSYGAARSVPLLAYFGDLITGAAVLSANPALANNPYALECAAGEGHESFVRLMLHYQPDLATRVAVGVRSQGPDSSIKNRAITDLLFQHGMNANFQNWLLITPLHRFASRGDIENATIFLDHGASIHARDLQLDSTPLAWAAKHGKKEMVEFLLQRGAQPVLPDDPAWATPLAWAERKGYKEIAEMLRSKIG